MFMNHKTKTKTTGKKFWKKKFNLTSDKTQIDLTIK